MLRRITIILLAICLTLLFHSAAQVQPSGGTVMGKILYAGDPPKPSLISMAKDPNCLKINAGKKTFDDKVVISSSGQVKNAFIHLKTGVPKRNFPPSNAAPVLDQRGCAYAPRVQGAVVGQSLKILNSDQTLHNIHSMSPKYLLNIAQPVAGMSYDLPLKTEELLLQLKCEIHTWMVAYVAVLPHPFFSVSDMAGAYTIKNVPAGTYTVQAWHETLGVQTKDVTVAAGQTLNLDFTFTAAKTGLLQDPGFQQEVVYLADSGSACH